APEPARSRRLLGLIAPGFGRLWIASVLLPLVCLVAAGWWTSNNVLASARGEMARTVDMVHEQVLRSLETQDAVLAGMEAFVAGMSWQEMRATPAAHDFANRIDRATPTVETLGVIDPTGRLAVASETPNPPQQLVLADRDYVRAWPAGRRTEGTFISPVVISRVDGRVQVHASRPRIGADGLSDGGVIASSFAPAYFEKFFSDIAETRQTGFTIIRDDGSLLADFPTPVTKEGETLPPGDLALEALRGMVPTQQAGLGRGVRFASSGSLLAGLHLVAIRPVRNYRMTIIHRMDPAVVTASWLRQMLSPTIGAAAAMALLLILTARAQATTMREQVELRSRTAVAEAGQAQAMERAELEARLRQTEKVAALGQLAAGVAHDFNNLLQTVILNAELLEGAAPEGSPGRRSAGLIITASERGIALTRRMLDHTRRESSPAPGTPPSLEVPAALRAVQDLLAGPLGAQYHLRLTIPPGLPPVRGEAAGFESALINLVVNARDAMPSGGNIAIEAAERQVAEGERNDLLPGRYVRVSVHDSGIGMDAATLARAGEAFFTTKGPGRGTGLGLSMARGFARRHEGALDLASVTGVGSTVAIWLPAV
ncbi:ATP-binding protein, partial [Thiomonas sp. SCN 64-16]|uniref:ATP-binding protein n=1 Tax=Thiomonas sp. SCN 64-16 TaxID=1660151 RepID=UPI00257E0D59